MTRFVDSLASALAGLLLGVLLVAAIAPGAWVVISTPRPAQDSPSPSGVLASLPPPARSEAPQPAPTMPAVDEVLVPAGTISGWATWYRSPAGVSAAGPQLRSALGPGWRGTRVRVCGTGDGPARCVVVTLGDAMRADRLIDLDDDAFARLAPLSRGLLRVTVTAISSPPETSTGGQP